MTTDLRACFAVLTFAIGLALSHTAVAQERQLPRSNAEIQLSFSPLVKEIAPAVVNVFTKTVSKKSEMNDFFGDPFFDRFFGRGFQRSQPRVQNSLGSGVFLKDSGLVVTNTHVIRGATEVQVVTHDRREFEAQVVFQDDEADLAFLQVEDSDIVFPSLSLGDSDSLEVGDLVLAIGNPFGVGQTVTSGIVSALARTGVGQSSEAFFIQTDAAINPGNSGGALVTMDGKLAGINTAIFSRSGGSNGIGFAIPSNLVSTFLREIESGEMRDLWIGMVGQELTSDLAMGLGLERSGGLVVSELYSDGPADEAGLESGDVITQVNGRNIVDSKSFRFRLRTAEPGAPIELTVFRKGEETLLALNPGAAPDGPRDETLIEGANPLVGAVIANITPALADERELDGQWDGVIIERIYRNSPAARYGFRPGDVLVAIDNVPLDSVADFLSLPIDGKGSLIVTFKRNGRTSRARLLL